MKCFAPHCRRNKILLVGVCLPHWKTLTLDEQEAIERTWLNLQMCHTDQNETAFQEVLALAFPPLAAKPARPPRTDNWKKTAVRHHREGKI